ncbi:hypothetical protein A3D77_03850 [Candidatus Gottesmanbacteria bacterium RIFCSPHIGHO2_02_FULL_39_11]|uniref:Uncharacterized protein n=1 Tax=Candidatus Gottesmanbacteria bacterium RIFCSPHIGHO2_02_FULL_39_11 TaxID=1798382 RepID=A0A1F5ZJZ1_9BACT|nr:MAG: hypothetical protein A3D77_03850 [Candidatus Gottesmanbacteria bacterium RIFCSPHIGHO2_02_FULL_39_11]
MPVEAILTPINEVRRISDGDATPGVLSFASSNGSKLEEIRRILEREVIGRDLGVPEIQDESPDKVIEAKAREARRRNGGKAIAVEDSSFSLFGLDMLPGPYADSFTNTPSKRQRLTDLLNIIPNADKRAVFQVLIAIDDGRNVHIRRGVTTGTIASELRGSNGFGFDDMFIPDGQEVQNRTFGEMNPEEKDRYSPRRKALEELRDNPFQISTVVFQLPEPYTLQTEAVKPDLLNSETIRTHVWSLRQFEGRVDLADPWKVPKRTPYTEVPVGGATKNIRRYVTDPNSADLGIIITPFDTAVDLQGRPRRLEVESDGSPVFWEMGDEAVRMAIAARAVEFGKNHNTKTYDRLRAMVKGELVIPPRANKRSPVIEEVLKIVNNEGKSVVIKTPALRELGIERTTSQHNMSRSDSADNGLFVMVGGVPCSLFSLGGMPPVTGWRDVLTTSALSHMDSYIPHNSIFAGHFEKQLQLFHEACKVIYRLHLPPDIEEMAIKHIGIAVGTEEPDRMRSKVKQIQDAGCSSMRVYTTNPDIRTITSAEVIRQTAGENMRICVGPTVDHDQIVQLNNPNIRINKALIGHGAGENCTSLEAGEAANALEILYACQLDPGLNNVALGLEGGVGWAVGPLIGMVDTISLNKRGIAGGIEMGGLFVQYKDGSVGAPYWGTASPLNQHVEAAGDKEIAKKRLDEAGRLINNEGKPNYWFKDRSVNSIVDNWHKARMLAGRALADMGVKSIAKLREKITKEGFSMLRLVTPESAELASAHRGRA